MFQKGNRKRTHRDRNKFFHSYVSRTRSVETSNSVGKSRMSIERDMIPFGEVPRGEEEKFY